MMSKEEAIAKGLDWMLDKLEKKQKKEHQHLDFLMKLMDMSRIELFFLGRYHIIKYLQKQVDESKLLIDIVERENKSQN